MIPALRKSLKSCRALKSAALDLESGAHAPLDQSNLLLGVLGYRKASFRSKRRGDFYDSFVRGERGFTVGFGESSPRPAGIIQRVVKSERCKSVKPRGSDIVQGQNVVTAWACLSGPAGNCANTSSIIPLYKCQLLQV